MSLMVYGKVRVSLKAASGAFEDVVKMNTSSNTNDNRQRGRSNTAKAWKIGSTFLHYYEQESLQSWASRRGSFVM